MEHSDLRRKITVMVAVLGALLFASLNQTIVGTALPRIASELDGMEYYSWVFTVYMLASTVTGALVGKLSDIFGRKPFILAGIVIFIIGSFLCGLSRTFVQLILFRIVQGLGAGVVISTSFMAVGDLFAPRERGRWQGIMGSVFGVSSVLGPALGGYIVDNADWHWVFWVFLPLGLVALLLIWILYPSVPRTEGEKVDYFGSLLLAACIVPLLLAFSWGGTRYDWDSPQLLGWLAVSALALVLFIAAERKASGPVLPLHLFKNSIFTLSNLGSFMVGIAMFGTIMYMPMFVQGVQGISATLSGYVVMPITLSMVISGAVGGQFITRTGKYKGIVLGGLVVIALGLFLASTMTAKTPIWLAILYMVIVGAGLGVANPTLTLIVQNAVPDRQLGVATASSQLFRQLGGTLGVSLLGTVMSHRVAVRMADTPPAEAADGGGLDPGLLQQWQNTQLLVDPDKLEQIRSQLPETLLGLFDETLGALRGALEYGLSGTFLCSACAVLAALVLMFWLKEIPLRTGRAAKPLPAGEADGTEIESIERSPVREQQAEAPAERKPQSAGMKEVRPSMQDTPRA
jgi:EmrB/QacA subfamily drug resistance transporter